MGREMELGPLIFHGHIDMDPRLEGITKSGVEILVSVADYNLDEDGFRSGIWFRETLSDQEAPVDIEDYRSGRCYGQPAHTSGCLGSQGASLLYASSRS